MKIYVVAAACAFIYFIAAYLTLSDYGISWDETIHFRRGQAYLHYFLTGNLNYQDLPYLDFQGTDGDPVNIPQPRRSFYQNDFHNGEYFLKNDSGHPPLNGELAALTNYIFFQKLGVIDDVSSHHLFNILASAFLVFIVVFFAVENFGIFAGIISFLSLITYPLFWAESHFNIKDPPEAAFFAATIWAFMQSIQKNSIGWIISTFIFFALALGTKLNILFLPAILAPYLLLRYRHNLLYLSSQVLTDLKKYLLVLVGGLVVVVVIFVGTWPYLWQNWPGNLFQIFEFYRGIGTGASYQPESFFLFGFNTFPLQWILFTTPPLTLAIFILGITAVALNKGGRNFIGVLLILWFLAPVIRVTMPGSVIYGGIRQIMEFLPAMALLSGLGAWQIISWCKKVSLAESNKKYFIRVVQIFLVLSFIWPVSILVKLHPNENVYFNSLIGGLSGARDLNFPSWGNSFGNAYFQGIKWINQNAGKEAKVALLQGTLANAPLIYFRSDIRYIPGDQDSGKKNFFSGINREGEYLMELTFNDSGKDFFYIWEYVEKFLVPVYEIKVDDVAILKVWKNDMDHTRPGMKLTPVTFNGLVNITEDSHFLYVDLNRAVLLSSVELDFDLTNDCVPLETGFMETSLDRTDWKKEKDAIPQYQINGTVNLQDRKIIYYLAGREVKYIRFALDSKSSCIFNNPRVRITSLEGI